MEKLIEFDIAYATEQNPELEARDELFMLRSLERLASLLKSQRVPGYPLLGERLADETSVGLSGDDLTIPFGPWDTTSQLEVIPPTEETDELQSLGLSIDRFGRPIHPWMRAMLTDRRLGLAAGKGCFWQWGPNDTADPIIIRRQNNEDELLLIQRRDTGQWALPGGFVDDGEEAIDAAVREAQEEAGINLADLQPKVTEIYWGPVADIRMTAHAWPNTTAYMFDIPGSAPTITKDQFENDTEVDAAAWMPTEQLHNTQLFGSHYELIELALHERRWQ